MGLLRNVKSFLLKEDYDMGRTDINMYHFHPQLLVVYMLNGVFYKNRESLARLVIPVLHSSVMLCAIVINLLHTYHGVSTKDYAIAAETLCYIMCMSLVPILYISMTVNRHHIISTLKDMNESFMYVCSLGPRYRDKFIHGQLIIWKGCWAWGCVAILAGFIYAINGFGRLLYQSMFVTMTEYTRRPMIFPIWLPYDDPYRTPNYEIFMFFEIWIIFIVNMSVAGYVYLKFHTLLHCYYMMDMIILDLEVIFDGLDESVVTLPKRDPRRMEVQGILNSRVKRIVEWHKAVFRGVGLVSSVFGPALAYQVMVSSPMICIVAYEIVVSLENGTIHVFFCVFWVEAILQLWIPCYLGSLIQDKAFSIADACWNCGWQKTPLGRMVCVDLVTIMLRSQKPLTIKFVGLPTLSLETFSSIMTSAYSYFNMLRQTT